MSVADRVHELLAVPGAGAIALDPVTAETVELPAEFELPDDRGPEGAGPMDLLRPDSDGQAVGDFAPARRTGL